MKKLISRLLVFFIGLPLVIGVVLFFPQRNHLIANIALLALSALGALEFADMMNRRDLPLSPVSAVILGILAPLATIITVSFRGPPVLHSAAFIFGAAAVLVIQVFSRNKDLQRVINRFAAGIAVMIYPGLFMSCIMRMALFPSADYVMLIFLLTVIANDSVAWAVGMLLGKGNRGIIPVSPNKSVAGFIGGLIASVMVGVGACFVFPEAFRMSVDVRFLSSIGAGAGLGLFSGAAASLGDLAESALKRSADIKDSGSIIPGRGGVLDSIDSLALAAPVYYLLYRLFFM